MPEPVESGREIARQLAQGIKVHLEFGDNDDAFIRAFRQAIRVRGGNPPAIRTAIDEPRWVLVKGYYDTGTIDGVFGPYTEAEADWLLSNALDTSYSNWTKARLSDGPEGSGDGPNA